MPSGDGIRNLRAGDRYLVSGDSIDTALQCGSVAWRISGGAARFVKMSPYPGDPRFYRVRILPGVVALMAPDASLPPTSTAATQASGTDGDHAIFMITIVVAALWALAAWSRRLRSPVLT